MVDARSLTNHGTDKYEMLSEQSFADVNAFDIAVLKRQGKCPSHASLYDDELINIVKELYKADFELYQEKFGSENLLF